MWRERKSYPRSIPFPFIICYNLQPDSYHTLVFILIWWLGLNIVGHLADPYTTQSLVLVRNSVNIWVSAGKVEVVRKQKFSTFDLLSWRCNILTCSSETSSGTRLVNYVNLLPRTVVCLFLQKSCKNVASNSKMRTELRQAGSQSNELKKTIYIWTQSWREPRL